MDGFIRQSNSAALTTDDTRTKFTGLSLKHSSDPAPKITKPATPTMIPLTTV
jgi:hypothetical protein